MTKSTKNNSVNSNAYAYMLKVLGDKVDVIQLTVVGKWLTAVLSSGIRFSVKNTG